MPRDLVGIKLWTGCKCMAISQKHYKKTTFSGRKYPKIEEYSLLKNKLNLYGDL